MLGASDTRDYSPGLKKCVMSGDRGNIGHVGGGGEVPEARERTKKGFLDEAVSKEPPKVSVGIS